MYKRIVMIVDSGIEPKFVASYALLIARAAGAKLYLVPAFRDPEIPANVYEIEHRAHEAGVETEQLAVETDLVRSVNKLVRDKQLDLIITGLRGERDGRFFIGTLGQRLMKHAQASVIGVRIVKARPITHHRKLLVPVSNRDYHFTERLFLIATLARSLELTVSLFRCAREPGRSYTREEKEAIFRESEEYLTPFISELHAGGIPAEVHVRVCDNATDGILDEAMTGHFDFLLVRALRRNVVKEFLGRNEMEEIIRRTPSNLLLWKSRE
ncbi:MAG TPA: universal stress protein [Methanomicrobia archaeon]|nr:universal stress protein [Methanomicrobia archaeon]